MKIKLLSFILIGLMCLSSVAAYQEFEVVKFTTTTATTWTVPDGVANITIDIVGGGGSGGGAAVNANAGAGGAGGGGGGHIDINVTAGQVFTVTQGAGAPATTAGDYNGTNGSNTIVNSSSFFFIAYGGERGLSTSTRTLGVGGGSFNNFTVLGTANLFTGGKGFAGASAGASGGGGSGASNLANGTNSTGTAGGLSVDNIGGLGGAGSATDLAGGTGNMFGGGGGGAKCDASCTVKAGGAGRDGYVLISYYIERTSDYPFIRSENSGRTASGTSHVATRPSIVNEGDLLLIVMSFDGVPAVTAPAGYTRLFTANYSTSSTPTQVVFYKFANSSETSTATFTSNATEEATYNFYSIANASTPTYAVATGSSTNANPPSIASLNNLSNYLIIASGSWDTTIGQTVTVPPTGYNNFLVTPPKTTGSAVTATSINKTNNINTTDPGTFTSTTEQWVASTIAIEFVSYPTVGAISPDDGTWTNDTTPDFNFSVNDSQSNRLNCYLSLDGTINATNASTMNNTNTQFTPAAAISEGTHNWTVNCSDDASNKGFSAERNISIDITGPVTTLDRPADNDNLSGTLFEVNASVIDAGINNISLVTFEYRINGTDTWKLACSDDRGPDYACTWNLTVLEDGTDYQFRVWANDTLRNIGAYDTHTNINITSGGYVITNAPANTRFVKAANTSVNVSQTGQSGVTGVLTGDSGATGNYSALINLDFSQDIDVSALSFGTNRTTAKSFIHNSSGITGLVNKSLLIPRINNVGSIYICPGATSLAQVDSQCSGVLDISTGQTVSGMTVSEVSYDSEDYYLVTNITGTGGGEPDVSNLIQCIFIQNKTCPSGTARLIGVENDTHNGYNNSHAQNYSLNTYNYSICCNNTNASINISGACPGNETVIRLSNATNAHIQIGNYSGAINYTNASACLGSSFKSVSCNYPAGSCTSPYACIMSMANSEGDNTTDAHVGSCSLYNQKVCCALVNSAPTKPTLLYPANGNTSVFERKINFTWQASTDPDGDAIEYSLNATCVGTCCVPVNIGDITTINYTVTNPLCVDVSYNWTVTACDQYLACNTSTIFNFTIASLAAITMVVNSTSFGNMTLNENNNTLDRSPTQLVVQNTGNVMVNVTINATKFFNAALTDTRYYQFEASLNDSGGYVAGCSQTTFANMSNTTQKRIYCNFSYDGMKKANIELNVTVPSGEPGGTKTSSIQLDCTKSEQVP